VNKRTSRGLTLTAKGRVAIGVPEPPVYVPLLTDAGYRVRFQPPSQVRGCSGELPPDLGRFLSSDGAGVYNEPIARATYREATRHD
jgi:hypothetical protein